MIRADLSTEHSWTDIPGGHDLLNAFALRGGKQFRPKLLLSVAAAFGVPHDSALPYAIAAERIHNATLLHDDVIDESSQRRGRPTLNANGKNRRAVLGGDLLLAETLRDLARTQNLAALRSLFEVLVELSEGEWLQLEARFQTEVTDRHLMEVSTKKTGSLIAWCCATPALLMAEPPTVSHAVLFRMGQHLGVAFQMIDDCIDFDLHSGKPFAQDLLEGQVNWVVHDVLARHPDLRTSVFTPALVERLTQEPDALLEPSLLSILKRAELEILSAQALLDRAGLNRAAQTEVNSTILSPFFAQIANRREALFSTPHQPEDVRS